MAIRIAAREPAVPGATGEKPAPKKVAKSQAGWVRLFGIAPVKLLQVQNRFCGNNVIARGPRSQVKHPAAFAAEGRFGVFQGN